MNSFEITSETKEAVVTGLKIAGFIALVALGIWLATYVSRYVPIAIGELNAAAVSLSQVFRPGTDLPGTGATTTPSGSEEPSATSTTPTSPVSNTGSQPRTPGAPSNDVVQIGGGQIAPHGLPDLVVSITSVGYITSPSTESFIASTTVPSGNRPAVKFTIRNAGTNVSGSWRFSASLPTSASPLYQSGNQLALGPNDYIEYTLAFEQPLPGTQTITISANFDRTVTESSLTNNNASADITIQ